jgi:catalase
VGKNLDYRFFKAIKFLICNIGAAPREIQIRHMGNCLKGGPAYGKGVAKALGIPLSELSKEA